MPVSLNTADRGDDAFPAEIYARHLKCSPPGGFNAWRKYSLEYTYPEIRGSSDLNNNDYPQQDCVSSFFLLYVSCFAINFEIGLHVNKYQHNSISISERGLLCLRIICFIAVFRL